MNYPEAVAYLESFVNYERLTSYPYKASVEIQRIKDFLGILGNPQEGLRYIHIAGTKGKGSACAFVAYILKQAGFKVGLYTSPHLSDFRERIRILSPCSSLSQPVHREEFEGMIPEESIVDMVRTIKRGLEKYNQRPNRGPLSFFEIYTALAFLYFRERKVDFAVLETGLGGRLDANNIVTPLVCGITPLSYEHTQHLGNRLSEIAAEKAGIIKDQVLAVISAPQEKEASDIINNKCKECKVRLLTVGKDIVFQEDGHDQTGSRFNLRLGALYYPGLEIRLLGSHQIANAALAIAIIEVLKEKHIFIDFAELKAGLYNTLWPGRLELLSNNPKIVIDGAQNVASACALRQAVKDNFIFRKLILILGFSQDKDIKGVSEALFELADEVILTKADNPRAADPHSIRGGVSGIGRPKIRLSNNVEEALSLADKKAGSPDLILITGSLFVAGQARKLIKERLACPTH